MLLSVTQSISLMQRKTVSSFPREWIAHIWGTCPSWLQQTWTAGDLLLLLLGTPISRIKYRIGFFISLKTNFGPLRMDSLARWSFSTRGVCSGCYKVVGLVTTELERGER